MNKQVRLSDLKDGDIIFTSVPNILYSCVEKATRSPTSHVGIVFNKDGEWVVAESRVPLSCYTPIDDFVSRSHKGWVCVKRLNDLSAQDVERLSSACDSQMGKLYHLGFDYSSKRQFCSKFVYDAFKNAMGIDIGELVTFRQLLEENPSASTSFWRVWFFGLIPWNRLTVTPGSQFDDAKLQRIV